MKETKEQIEKDIELGNREEDVYTEAGREVARDSGAMTAGEEGFMEGYEEGAKMAECPKCGKIIERDFIEREIDGEHYRFCSETCAETYKK